MFPTPEACRTLRSVDAEALGSLEMLAGVGLAERCALLDVAELRDAREGDAVIVKDAPGTHMYLVVEGSLGVHLDSVDGDPIATISAGESVGELGVLDGSPTSAHVVALEPTRLLVLDEGAFWNLVNASHGFAVGLLTKLAARLRANNTAVSDSVQKRRMYERAAMFDGLTGIHNRRWLDETLHRLVKRCELSGGTLSLSLIDIDHFKQFNDTYGHDAGDHVLTTVAGVLSGNLRPTDLVARFGGEEFLIIFPETDLPSAVIAAERVRVAVAHEPLAMPDGTELPNVTISMGVSQWSSGTTVPTLLKGADSAMYRAKRGGRNRVVADD